MAVFTDPYCAACQAFERTAQQLDDVTLYVFLLPVIRPDRKEVSQRVWCSPDRAQAWRSLTTHERVPEAAANCANPIDANLAMVPSIGIRATPTLIFADGRRGQGNLATAAVEERLERSSRAVIQTAAR